MFQGILALTVRTMRGDERSIRMHLVRFAIVLLSFLMAFSSFTFSGFLGAPGLDMFKRVCRLDFFAILMAATSYFATSISEEKEEMTLGLLKMAGVSPVALVMGKGIPRLLIAALLITLQLPFTMLAITLGGVSLPQVLAAYVTLLALLFAVSQFAILMSTLCALTARASSLTSLGLVAYFLLPTSAKMMVGFLADEGYVARAGWCVQSVTSIADGVNSTSAYSELSTILTTGFAASPWSWQVVSNGIAGLIFFGLAWLALEPFSRNERPAAPPRGWLQIRLMGRGWFSSGRAWDNWALTWHAFNFSFGGNTILFVKFLLYPLLPLTFAWATYRDSGRLPRISEVGGMFFGLMCAAIGLELLVMASRLLYPDVKWKTLSSLVILPISPRRLVWCKIMGCVRALIPALVYLGISGLCVLADVTSRPQALNNLLDPLVEPGFWYAVTQELLLLHCVVLGTLYVKWGGVPLAIAAIYFFNATGVFLMMLIPGIRNANNVDFMLSFGVLVTLCLVFGIQAVIVKRINVLAAKD